MFGQNIYYQKAKSDMEDGSLLWQDVYFKKALIICKLGNWLYYKFSTTKKQNSVEKFGNSLHNSYLLDKGGYLFGKAKFPGSLLVHQSGHYTTIMVFLCIYSSKKIWITTKI